MTLAPFTKLAHQANRRSHLRRIVQEWLMASLVATTVSAVSCSGSEGAIAASSRDRALGGDNAGQGGVVGNGGTLASSLGPTSGGTAANASTSLTTGAGGSRTVGGQSSMGGVTTIGGENASGGYPLTGGTSAIGDTSGGTTSTATLSNAGVATGMGGRSGTGSSRSTGSTLSTNAANGGSKVTGGAGPIGGESASGGVLGIGGTGSVNLPAGVTALFPSPHGQNTCVDPTLRVTLSGAPKLGSSGSIRVFDTSGKAVVTIDMSADTASDTIGGRSFTILRPVYIDGNTVSIRLPSKGLSYGQTYYVNVTAGALSGPNGSLSITDSDTWRFTTRADPPGNLATIGVATDGSGQFCTVQGAIDAIPPNNSTPRTINVEAGTYHEIVYFTRKDNITIQGTDRNGTILAATNNNNVNPSTQGRALFGVDSVAGLQIRSMTIHNLTPQGGSQAEALRLQKCDQCVILNSTLKSLQDTLLWSGRVYAHGSLIEGNVDYIWGTGVAYFDKCEIRTVGRTGVIVQSRNDVGTYGYVFVDSKLTADAAATNNMLARIDVSAYPGSHVTFIDCQMTNIGAAGWTITGGSPPASLRFWEYQSTDSTGNPISMSQRAAGSARISATQAAQMRDPAVVLGGWRPPME